MTLVIASTAGIAGSDAVILWTFFAAALVFFLCLAVRTAMGKTGDLRGPVAAPKMSAEDAALYAPQGGPPPLPDSPYAPPVVPSPPALPVAAEPPRGLFKVGTAPYRWLDLPLIGLVFLVYAGLTAGSGASDETPLDQKFTPEVLVASIFFQFLLMGMVVAFVAWRVRITEWLGLRWRLWPLAIVIAPAVLVFMWCLMGALHVSGWNAWLEKSLGIESMQEAVKLLQQAQDPAVVALMAVAAVLVAPLAEEVVFRGYLYPAAKRFCGTAGGIVFSSLVFAAAHGNVVALAPLFLLAVLLCLIFEFTGSIWACISVHFLFNGATVAIQLLARSGIIDLPAET